MSVVSARELALEALLEWEGGHAHAADLVDRLASKHGLAHRDTAMLHTVVFSVLRNLSLLDIWLAEACDNRKLEDRILWLLRSGAAQLLLLEMPAHAVVNETVNQAGKARGLVNAVLRRLDRERRMLADLAARLPLADRTSHPEWLVRRWIQQHGEKKTTALCDWDQLPAKTFIRVNQLHPSPLSTDDLAGLQPVNRAGFYAVVTPPRDWLVDGRCYAQDPSTALACELLAPRPGESVLDACAAPGGKTAYLAQMMGNQGRLVAADVGERRLVRLSENLKRLRVRLAATEVVDWVNLQLPAGYKPEYDRILIDAPCSNTGVLRRRVDARWRIEPGTFKEMNGLQLKILASVARLLKPGGSMVYSTCSLDREENEAVVKEFLSRHRDFSEGETRISTPWDDGFDGSFAALLVKS